MNMPISQSGLLIVISGPAGSGKTTLSKRMLVKEPSLHRVVTSTTRKPRKGEKDHIDYHFFDRPAFEAKIKANEFYEYAQVHNNLYGTLKSEVQDKLATGTDLLLVIDVQGANSLREKAKTDEFLKKRLVTVFIMPSGLEELEQRLRKRAADDDDEIQRRLRVAVKEMKQYNLYDYCLHSKSRDEDFESLRAIYHAEKMRNR
jgi:guanylate kinase